VRTFPATGDVTLLRRRRAAARLALTAETATKGTGFTSNFNYDAATNRLLAQGVYSYDANGNLTAMPSITNTYDIENRLQQAVHTLNGTEQYVYNPSNQRVWKKDASQSETAYIYGPDGARLATMNASWGNGLHFGSTTLELRLGGRLITSVASGDSAGSLVEDRLGSVGASQYFPYGETRSGGAGFQFATYRSDSATQFYYAQNRYYYSKIARFLTPDPYKSGAKFTSPQSWNRYAYVEGDPVNMYDPAGLEGIPVMTCWLGGFPFWGGGTFFWGTICDMAYSSLVRRPPQVAREPKTNYPECNPTGNPVTEMKLNFISNYYDDALDEANQIQLDLQQRDPKIKVETSALATMFLQWSANEGGYGRRPVATQQHNFFGMQQGSWGGIAIPCPAGLPGVASNTKNACFPMSVTWSEELAAALDSTSPTTDATYLSALEDAVLSGSGAAGILQAIAGNGWNASPTYGSDITSGIKIQSQIDCLEEKHGL